MRERICDAVLAMVEENRGIIQNFCKGNFNELSQFETNAIRCMKLLAASKRLYSEVPTSEEKERLRAEIEQLLAEITSGGLSIRLAEINAQKLLIIYEKCGTDWWQDNSYNRYLAEEEGEETER